jgi:mono/diheme cytochrome c family protein
MRKSPVVMVLGVVLGVGVVAACEQKAPNAPAAQPGQAPAWGQGFGTQAPAAPGKGAQTILDTPPPGEASKGELPPGHPPLGNAPPGDMAAKGLPVGNAAVGPAQGQMPNDSVHAGLKPKDGAAPPEAGHEAAEPPPGKVGRSGTDWGGGDPAVGRNAFQALCARCHGAEGKGGNVAGVGPVPNLTDPAVRAKWTGDAMVASKIANGGGAMPSFMADLDLEKLRGLVAYVKSLGN